MSRVCLAVGAAVCLLASAASAQPFAISVVERTDLVNAPALQSGAYAEHSGRWLFVAGRTNGLHAFAGDPFPREFENGAVVVYEPSTDTRWTAPLDGLDAAIVEHLRTTNPEFLSRGDSLIVAGGYGHRDADGTKVTFGAMTVLDVPEIIEAVISGGDLVPHIRQPIAWDDDLAVTGGHLVALGDRLALVGGNRFDGEYTSNFAQTYTEAVRTFGVGPEGLTDVTEAGHPNLHRRDGNVAPTVLDDGSLGLGVYGGVFTPTTQSAFLRPIRVSESAALDLEPAFEQHVGHYTTPVLPLYDSETGAMHTVFFGGINGFIWEPATEEWVAVGNPPFLPFTNDVAVLTRDDNAWSEHFLTDLPDLLGTNAAFFLDPALPFHADEIVDFDALPAGETTIGWIVGGIDAEQPSFGPTSASSRVLEVRLTKGVPPATEGPAALAFALGQPAPNPARGNVRLSLVLDTPQAIRAEVLDVTGRRIATLHDGRLGAGPHTLAWDAHGAAPGLYLLRVTGADGRGETRRVVLAR